MKNKIPDRWQNYSQFGDVVPGTQFIAFKTPLKEELCRRHFDLTDDWFTPAMLREKIPNLKLVIDLTFTDRYYNAKELVEHGIQHVKIKCPGGGQRLPPKHVSKRFNSVICNFLLSNPNLDKDNLIGVHCTHGLNRTGYFICRYMVEHYGLTSEQSIMAFEKARGHKMERDVYVKEIHKHYKDIKSNKNIVHNHVHKPHHRSGTSSQATGSTPNFNNSHRFGQKYSNPQSYHKQKKIRNYAHNWRDRKSNKFTNADNTERQNTSRNVPQNHSNYNFKNFNHNQIANSRVDPFFRNYSTTSEECGSRYHR